MTSMLILCAVVAVASANTLRFEPAGGAGTAVNVQNQAQTEITDKRPKFCNGIDCPKFSVLNKTKDYEIRQYDATGWVSTNSADISYETAQYQNFMRLFQYISGNNIAKQKIAMTCPVIVRIIPGQGPACENNFTMSFFVSPTEGTPPAPSSQEVKLDRMDGMKVYVKSFGGFASQQKYIDMAQALAEALPSSEQYYTEFWYTAGYDAPFKFLNRHNEVWFIGK